LSKSAIVPLAAVMFPLLTTSVSARQDVASVVAQADALYDTGAYHEAAELIRPALAADPDNYVLLWKLADNITEWARIESEDATKEESEARYMEAVGFARQAVEIDRNDAEGWYQLGKALGRLALFRGGKEKVNMSKEIKEVFEHAIQLDPQHADALHGLARWHREVANLGFVLKAAAKIVFGGLPPASNEESVELFKRAIEIEPQNCAHHLELGKTYLEMREKDLAAEEFEEVLSLPVSDPDDPEWKAEAEELLDKIRR
jgi:tetratricopeptide (TPR) repeat protein